MADEDTTVQTDDSVQQDTQADVDWQKRFTDTQAEYTKQQQALKDEQSVWEDEQALIARVTEKFPHLIADDPETVEDDDSFEDDDEPEVMTKAEFKDWQAEQQQKEQADKSQQQYQTDLLRFVGDRELDENGLAVITSQNVKGPEELEQAVNAWFEYLDSLSGGKRKRKTTAPLAGGKTATGVPDYGDMNHDQAVQAMVDRARSLDTQI